MIKRNKPYLKLTFMYASILCFVSVIFSTIIYSNTVNSFNIRPIKSVQSEAIIKRDNEIKKEMLLKTGMVFQTFNLFPHMSVRNNTRQYNYYFRYHR